ncbi:MAG: dephospho-CoA kinase [Candidatus Altimarinota bacterium]
MKRIILGIGADVGGFGTEMAELLEQKGFKKLIINDLIESSLWPGNEGYRQIINFFGEEFLDNKGFIKLVKLFEFLYNDHNKLKIFNFSLYPIITNDVQKFLDVHVGENIVMEADNFAKNNWGRFVDKLIWLQTDEELRRKRFADLGLEGSYFDKIERSYNKLGYKPDWVDEELKNIEGVGQLEVWLGEFLKKENRA